MSLKKKLLRQLGDIAETATPEKSQTPVKTSVQTPAASAAVTDSKRAMLLELQKKLAKIAPTSLGNEQILPPKQVKAQKGTVLFEPQTLPGAHEESNQYGLLFFVESRFTLPYLHGQILLTTSTAALQELTKDQPEFSQLEKMVFFDLETTGLAGGSGTIPFMIGAGRLDLDNNCFIIRQYFARTPDEETAMLAHFRQFVGNGPLASFNGQTFDLPLLTSRFIMNRLPPDFEQLAHLDLITLSRRLWKARLRDCSLKNLEENCMGINRQDDVDGSEVPQIYLDYLNQRPAPLLERVFYHNKIDILTLLALAYAQVKQLQLCAEGLAVADDLYSYAHFLLENSQPEKALELYKQAASGTFSSKNNRLSNLEALAFLTKKLQGRPAAVCYWQRLLELAPTSFTAAIEICKYLEHDLRHYQEALDLAKKCRDWSISYKDRQDLEHRIRRLKDRLDNPDQQFPDNLTAFDP